MQTKIKYVLNTMIDKLMKFPHSLMVFIFILTFLTCCKKKEEAVPSKETGTLTDVDNNTYKTIKIGNQWWMAENLKVTKFRNGVSIAQNQNAGDWQSVVSSSYCIYDNNTAAPGLLYNFFVVVDTNIVAPIGWHVPSDEEWKILERNIGMSSTDADKLSWRGNTEGEKLKIEAPQGWTTYDDVWSTNESGFSALAGSCRLFNGTWGSPGLFATGFWWSSTSAGNDAWYRYLDYKKTNVFRFYGSKKYGFSIRCVKD